MTTLEIILLILLYIIIGTIIGYKQYNCKNYETNQDIFLTFCAFLLNPLWIIIRAIKTIFYDQW